jgi:hypothetical protein
MGRFKLIKPADALKGWNMNLPGWILAIFLIMAAAVPVAATLFFPPNQSYTEVGPGTGQGKATQGAPGPVAGAGLSVAAIAYGVYWAIKRRRRKPE